MITGDDTRHESHLRFPAADAHGVNRGSGWRYRWPTPTLDELRKEAAGCPVWIGRDDLDRPVAASGRTAMVSCFGPPGAGKTSGLIVPSLLLHDGPVIATSTKADLISATVGARLLNGPVWWFDPSGMFAPPDPRIRVLRWSPLCHAHNWDLCRVMAAVMTEVALTGEDRDASYGHFKDTAGALLGAALHLLALRGERSLRGLVLAMADPQSLAVNLAQLGAEQASDAARVISCTGDREFGSIQSTAWRAVSAYQSPAAVAASDDPNVTADELLDSCATVFIVGVGSDMAPVAPIYSAWLEMMLRAKERAALRGAAGPNLLLALDEVANICPLPRLPRIIAEGPGKGIAGLFCFQDLAQAHARWRSGTGELFRAAAPWRVLLPGVTNLDLLDWVSRLSGETAVEYVSDSFVQQTGACGETVQTSTIVREWRPVRSLAEAANPGAGRLLVVGPDASVSVAHQARAHEDSRFVDAAREADKAAAALFGHPHHGRARAIQGF